MNEINEKSSLMRWDDYYLNMLDSVRSKSKDTSIKVGAIIVNKDNKIVSSGYNGFPIGTRDDPNMVPERYERPMKYDYTIHAELNSILLHARSGGEPLKDCRMYCSLQPCAACAAAIVQAGIKEVIAYPAPDEMMERLATSFKFNVARTILKEAEVDFLLFKKN